MTRDEALVKAKEINRPQMFQNPGFHGDHGMVRPCGCAVITVGFTREIRTEYCQGCLDQRRKEGDAWWERTWRDLQVRMGGKP